MSRQPRALVVVAAALAALVGAMSGADATVEATCMAAVESDQRVNFGVCTSELGKHRDSPDADTWGLAKVAANVGVSSAGGAVNDVDALLAARPPPDAKEAELLRRCRKVFFDMELAFAGAYDEINARNYTAGKLVAAEGANLVRRCGGGFADAGLLTPPLIEQRGAYAMEIATICTAITNLIKP
ncbi:hypothetical protein ACP70R_026997 [Stipagrostis hirtigluma subsp. patula]